jgi:putative ABC transport system permease protein
MRLALRQLVRHKVRSFLTMLGILIGVGSVVAIVSLGEGLREIFLGTIASQASADILWIMPDAPMRPGHMAQGIKPFKNHDVDIVAGSEYISNVYGIHIQGDTLIKHGWRSELVTCVMAPEEYFPMRNWKLAQGRLYNEAEKRGRALVCVVGGEIRDRIFDEGESVIGSFIQIKGQRFRVIGELENRSAIDGGGKTNTMIFIPLTTGQDRLLGTDDMFIMLAQVLDTTKLKQAEEDISQRLRQSRHIRSGADDDFVITAPDEWAGFANDFLNTLIVVFGVVAVVSLVVGGIGVMNIMLVNVRERTREIGLRKALGATAAQITWQFLVEAMTLTIVGGLIGLVTGWLLGFSVTLIMKSMWDVFWMPSVPTAWIVVVFGVSCGLGLVFGVYPAWRAGILNPIDALRYE